MASRMPEDVTRRETGEGRLTGDGAAWFIRIARGARGKDRAPKDSL